MFWIKCEFLSISSLSVHVANLGLIRISELDRISTDDLFSSLLEKIEFLYLLIDIQLISKKRPTKVDYKIKYFPKINYIVLSSTLCVTKIFNSNTLLYTTHLAFNTLVGFDHRKWNGYKKKSNILKTVQNIDCKKNRTLSILEM